MAWSGSKSVKITDFANKSTVEINAERTQFMEWSPKDNYLSTWEVFAIKNGKQDPNLKIWSSEGKLLASFVQRKSDGWAPRWSNNEELVAVRTPNNEVAYFRNGKFETPEKKLSLAKMPKGPGRTWLGGQ